ncbi:MAG: type IV pilus biogenesis/stability protein PilW [Gammaproteobacteria bacterium]|nr:type IV pilus biogenesis/stability protein PilW [Gammaproteobacteria bacterium]MDH5650826.1 type IV pilus biogenesis/stability protein PilW [Gammaproteobacteria bacterium]
MNQPVRILIILTTLWLGACTTEVIRTGVDYKKAAEANAKLGLGYMEQGNFELAMSKLKKALNLDQDCTIGHHYIAELYRRLGEMKKAEQHYRRAMELDKDDTDIQNNYGVFLCDQGKYKEADGHFEKVLENPFYTTRSKVYENIALCAKRKGDLKRAEHHFNKALLMNSRLPKSLLEMAILNHDRGDHTSAYSYYQRFIQYGQQTAASLWMGVLLESKEGNRTKAASYALLLKKQFPQSREAVLAGRFLEKHKRSKLR